MKDYSRKSAKSNPNHRNHRVNPRDHLYRTMWMRAITTVQKKIRKIKKRMMMMMQQGFVNKFLLLLLYDEFHLISIKSLIIERNERDIGNFIIKIRNEI